MKTITWDEVKKMVPCVESIPWAEEHFKNNLNDPHAADLVIEILMNDKKYDWANWLIVRCMTRPQYLGYAIFAAEQVIDIYEKEYPEDKGPRGEIESAKRVLKNDNEETRAAAWTAWAAGAAWAARAARAAAEAAWAAWAARAAGAVGAAWAARAAAGAAWAARAAAEATGAAAEKDMQIKILNFGLKLLREEIDPMACANWPWPYATAAD